ncbi:hypothetical protein [Streptomyces himastatinicus]|nr:hypothetical protein [Streptomyces himastatinicus]
MSIFGTRNSGLTVIHDLDVARAAIEEALADADPELAPGLRHALDLIAQIPEEDAAIEVEWARSVIAQAGIDPSKEVQATKALRVAKPELSLKAAVELARNAAR